MNIINFNDIIISNKNIYILNKKVKKVFINKKINFFKNKIYKIDKDLFLIETKKNNYYLKNYDNIVNNDKIYLKFNLKELLIYINIKENLEYYITKWVVV